HRGRKIVQLDVLKARKGRQLIDAKDTAAVERQRVAAAPAGEPVVGVKGRRGAVDGVVVRTARKGVRPGRQREDAVCHLCQPSNAAEQRLWVEHGAFWPPLPPGHLLISLCIGGCNTGSLT